MGKPKIPSKGGDHQEESALAVDTVSTFPIGYDLEESCSLMGASDRTFDPTSLNSATALSSTVSPTENELYLSVLIESVRAELLPNLRIESIAPHDPVVVHYLPSPWQLIGTGNYAAVVYHPDHPSLVVKIYAPGRPGFEEEVEVYHRLGSHPAFSECFYASDGFLILKRLHGTTLYDCIQQGVPIPEQVIRDIDEALDYARGRGLYPHDIHGRNVMMHSGRGLVVDISDFLHEETCNKWNNLKKAYYLLYRPVLSPLRVRVPSSALNVVRKSYRFFSRRKRVAIAVGVGMVGVLVTSTVITHWREPNESCVRYLPDGSQQTLYGSDCKRPIP